MTGPELIERVARALEPSAFATYDRGATVQNLLAEVAFLNAEKVIKRARKKAGIALAAFLAATREPEMVECGQNALCNRYGSMRQDTAADYTKVVLDAFARELGVGDV